MKRPKLSVPIDANDLLTFGGLAFVGAGLWLVLPAAALVTVGVLLIAFGLVRAWVQARSR